jgi:hypothetical protein
VPKLYIYKMTTDNGGAPCVKDGTLSLAICKPAIRSSATEGDVILGFAANSLYENNCLVYAATVTLKLNGKRYYANAKYTGRPDCIYEFEDGKYSWRAGARYHSEDDLHHDLGFPDEYDRANVLLSEDYSLFRYFGATCPLQYRKKYRRLGDFITTLKQGHRVNLDDAVKREALGLLNDVWATAPTPNDTGASSGHCGTRCGEDEGEGECEC